MTNDVTTALELLAEGQANTIDEWVKAKQKELMIQKVSCCFEDPCIKCRCLFCSDPLPTFHKFKNDTLHDKCYYQILIDEVIS